MHAVHKENEETLPDALTVLQFFEVDFTGFAFFDNFWVSYIYVETKAAARVHVQQTHAPTPC